MMGDDIGQGILLIFGGVLTLAFVSVIVGQNSRAPAAIQAGGSALANVVAAAVAPVGNAANNGNNASSFTTPSISSLGGLSL